MRLHDLYLLTVILAIEIARHPPLASLDMRFAHACASLAFRFSRAKRERILCELERCRLSPPDVAGKRLLVQKVFFAFWKGMFTRARRYEDISSRAAVSGVQHLQDALAVGRGAILWESSGFGERAAAQAILHSMGYNVVQVHAWLHLGGIGAGDAPPGWFLRNIIHPYFDRREREWVKEIIYLPTGSSLAFTRALVDRLAHNAVVCIAADGAFGQKHLDLPFLGRTHSFPTGIVSLAQFSGAPLMPLFCVPAPDNGYSLEIGAPFAFDAVRQEQARVVISHYVEMLQARICAHPEWYRRWDLRATHME